MQGEIYSLDNSFQRERNALCGGVRVRVRAVRSAHHFPNLLGARINRVVYTLNSLCATRVNGVFVGQATRWVIRLHKSGADGRSSTLTRLTESFARSVTKSSWKVKMSFGQTLGHLPATNCSHFTRKISKFISCRGEIFYLPPITSQKKVVC